MKKAISLEEIESLIANIKSEMLIRNLPADMIEGTRLIVIHPEYWEVSLLVPCKSQFVQVKPSEIRKVIDFILFDRCGANPDGCDYLGKQARKNAFEWYFRHPNIPQEINDLIEAEIEADLGEEIGLGLPIPSGRKSNSDTAFITVKDEFFKEIELGVKKVEYRALNQYYCDKLLSPGVKKTCVKINRGYASGSGNQMTFKIAGIYLVDEHGNVEVDAFGNDGKPIVSYSQLPKNFAPAAYAIKLGERIA